MNRIRQTIELMHATCKEVSMRRKLVAYWASMIFVLLAAMLILASLFGVFSIRESNLRHALDAHHASTVASVKKQTSVLAAHAIALSQESSNALDHQLLTHPTSKLNDDPEGIARAERALFSVLRTALETSPCSGAFVIIDATVNTQIDNAENSSRRRVHQVCESQCKRGCRSRYRSISRDAPNRSGKQPRAP